MSNKQHDRIRGKTLEQIYGKERAKQILEKRRTSAQKQAERQRGKTLEELYGERAADIRRKLSEQRKGNTTGFKKGVPSSRKGTGNTRYGSKYANLQESVYTRDNWKCVECGNMDQICLHHIRSWKEYPELRFEVDNCTTLCRACHCRHEANLRWKSEEFRQRIKR